MDCNASLASNSRFIECLKLKPNPKESLWPITKDTGNLVSQSKLEASMCSRQKGRENVCKRAAIGFGFTSDWFKNSKAKQGRNEQEATRGTCLV